LQEAEYNLATAKESAKKASEEEAKAIADASREASEFAKAKDTVVLAQSAMEKGAYNASSAFGALASNASKAYQEVTKASGFAQTQNNAVFNPTFRAGGGSVSPNQPYFVGDNPDGSLNRTSELFVPRSAGSIISSKDLQSALGGGAVGAGIYKNIWGA